MARKAAEEHPIPATDAAVTYFLHPSPSQVDYIVLSDLKKSIARHADELGGRVLDYGCGSKPYATLFSNATEYVGADFPDNPHADIRLDPAGRLPDVRGFDGVVSTQVLEHADPGTYLSECRRVLAERKGKLLLTTHGIWMYHPHPQDLYRWTHEGLVHTIEQFGFTTRLVEPVTTGLRMVLQVLACRIYQKSAMKGRPLVTHPFYWALNRLADHVGDEPNLDYRLRDFPIDYLYLGEVRP
jgi:SAM-dependent methyltransferase